MMYRRSRLSLSRGSKRAHEIDLGAQAPPGEGVQLTKGLHFQARSIRFVEGVRGIPEDGHYQQAPDRFLEELERLRGCPGRTRGEAGNVAPRSSKTGNKAGLHRIGNREEHDWSGGGCGLRSMSRRCVSHNEHPLEDGGVLRREQATSQALPSEYRRSMTMFLPSVYSSSLKKRLRKLPRGVPSGP